MEDCACDRYSAVYSSPLGPIRVTASDKGICCVDMMFGKHYSKEDQQYSPPNECSSTESSKKHITTCLQWLDSYFCGDRDGMKAHMPQLDLPHNENFYNKVWQALLSVKYGETVTYGEIAVMTGSPGAARAVGQAVHQHHLPLLVPCHRVVYSGGRVGNYSGGDGKETKQWLLQHEAQT